jgi:hypothetical protein
MKGGCCSWQRTKMLLCSGLCPPLSTRMVLKFGALWKCCSDIVLRALGLRLCGARGLRIECGQTIRMFIRSHCLSIFVSRVTNDRNVYSLLLIVHLRLACDKRKECLLIIIDCPHLYRLWTNDKYIYPLLSCVHISLIYPRFGIRVRMRTRCTCYGLCTRTGFQHTLTAALCIFVIV